jgi:hypothetical protein
MANAAGAADAVTTFSPMATPDSLTVTDLAAPTLGRLGAVE